jgi:hypothetical protein
MAAKICLKNIAGKKARTPTPDTRTFETGRRAALI